MAWIILRDLPSPHVQLDVLTWQAGAGCCGFQNVREGYHFVRLLSEEGESLGEAEVFLNDARSVEVLRYDPDLEVLVWEDDEDSRRLAGLASSGRMDRALLNVLEQRAIALAWQEATSTINESPQGREVPAAFPADGGSRFKAWWDYHSGDLETALEEVQAMFLLLLLFDDTPATDHFARLLQAHYNAGESGIELAPEYFVRFARSLSAMLTLAPALLRPGNAVTFGMNYLIEDMRDAGDSLDQPALVEAANALKAVARSAGASDKG